MRYLEYLKQQHPIRRSKEQKSVFRQYVLDEAKKLQLSARVEATRDGKNQNLVIGEPEEAEVIFTAHYDTPACSLFPNLMIPRNKPLFFVYQFLPVTLLLALSLGLSYLIGMVWLGDTRAYMLSFLVLYYGVYFLGFRTFSNKNNCNDNTSGVATLLEIMERLPKESAANVAFLFFDNEEKGKKGSKAYVVDHKNAMEKKLIINFDCVGNGKHIVFIAKDGAEKLSVYAKLKQGVVEKDGFTVSFYGMKGSESNSDYKNFPCGVGCMACKQTKKGLLYTPYIHTNKDVVANQENIDFLVGIVLENF
ncbi:MAG: M28 family peptidase [Clostridia bacterium]|nr:M28 family peptidase [Clostridia bacterium]